MEKKEQGEKEDVTISIHHTIGCLKTRRSHKNYEKVTKVNILLSNTAKNNICVLVSDSLMCKIFCLSQQIWTRVGQNTAVQRVHKL